MKYRIKTITGTDGKIAYVSQCRMFLIWRSICLDGSISIGGSYVSDTREYALTCIHEHYLRNKGTKKVVFENINPNSFIMRWKHKWGYKEDQVATFYTNQKVCCYSYHEDIQYPNKVWVFDKPFSPVKFGLIIGDAGIRPYYSALPAGTQRYLWVKFKEYKFNKAIPISCMQDAKQYGETNKRMLAEAISDGSIGKKGSDLKSALYLEEKMKEAEDFVNS